MSFSSLFPALILATALAAPAIAADSDPVATSDGKSPPLTTAEQIDNYLKTSPALPLPADRARGVTSSEEPRKMHGEAEIAVGTGGYRSAYARADLPVGKTGVVSVAVRDTRFNGRSGPRSYQNLGLGFAFGGAAEPANGARACRRTTDRMGGPMSRSSDLGLGFDGDGRPCRAILPSAAD